VRVTQSLLQQQEVIVDIPYVIERAEAKHENTYLQLLERYVTTKQAKERYQWLYKNNPQGRAETWLAYEPTKREIVGFTSIFAREFLISGKSVLGGIGFDAFVRPDHRRRGIALKLHRASLKAMATGEVAFRFMCGPPTSANLEALVKAGSQVVGALRYIGIPFTARGLMTMLRCPDNYTEKVVNYGAPLDMILTQVRKIFNRASLNITVKVANKVDSRYDQLWNKIAANFPVVGLRDAKYLNWRYLQNPVCSQQLLSLEYKGELLGWAVLEFASKGCLLVDYLLPLEEGLAKETLSALVNYVAQQKIHRLTLRFNFKGQYAGLFRGHAFLPGRTIERFQLLSNEKELYPPLLEQQNWHFTNGDLNPEASPWSINTAPEAILIDPNYIPPISNGTRPYVGA